jgi:hypothetical protein
MSHEHASTAGPAVAVIDVNEEASLAVWCVRLGVTEDALRAAVAMVGPMPAAVGFYLQGRHVNRRPITDETRQEVARRRSERLASKERARETARTNGRKQLRKSSQIRFESADHHPSRPDTKSPHE